MNFIEKFNNYIFSKKSIPVLAGVLSLGLLLVVFSGDIFETDNKIKTTAPKVADEAVGLSSCETDEHDASWELENILSDIKGVGDVNVKIIYKSTSEKLTLKLNDKNGNETAVFENNNSTSKPFVTKEKYPEIEGIIIVAKGGGNSVIKNEITNAVSDVYNIPIHKVKVFEMK